MKIKLTGECGCLDCGWSGKPNELIETENAEVVKCPQCDYVLIDMRNNGLKMDKLKGGNVEIGF